MIKEESKKKADCRSNVERIEASEKQKIVNSTQQHKNLKKAGGKQKVEACSSKGQQKTDRKRKQKGESKNKQEKTDKRVQNFFLQKQSYRTSYAIKMVMVMTKMVAQMKPGNTDKEDNA